MTHAFETSTPFFAGNATFVEELFERYLQNPNNVDASWREFFKDTTNGAASAKRGASWATIKTQVIGAKEEVAADAKAKDKKGASISQAEIEKFAHDSIRAIMMVRAYRVRGHLLANLDPLGIEVNDYHAELDPMSYGFSESDMDKEIFLDGSLGIKKATLREILNILRATYCGYIGVEFMHIMDPEQKAWIQKRIEGDRGPSFSKDQKKAVWNTMMEVESFEQFLQVKYPSTKRFSVQGGDAMLPGLESVIQTASSLGVKEIIIGMPHRGRMNVLTTTMGKPYAEMFSLFQGNIDFPDWVASSGDVKYHLGTSSDRETPNGKVHLSLLANPSHLEAVNPVVVGKVRAKLDIRGDVEEKDSVMGIMLHGDAAFCGQGSVPEVLSLSELRGYRTGGSIHIIVNNQIGFTTSPKYSRFTPYPTDVAKMVQAPIFHVNADDPESVVYVCKLAAEFRQQFKRDAVVDVICYRKYGHNESDEPAFTQPIMYREIAKKPLPATLYSDRLVAEGTLSQAEVDAKFAEYKAFFNKQYDLAQSFKPNKADWLEGQWSGLEKPTGEHPAGDTGVDVKKLKEIGNSLARTPEHIKVNPKILRQFEAKKKMMETGEGLDWAMGEALAYGSLVTEGHGVRLSGQDCGRGTFSHRHSVLVDQETEERYVPLNNINEKQAAYEVIDSSLSEFAILGFEYGYSLANPNSLTLWEAQFGDFANGAQVIVDQFISSAEVKWLRMSGLVMLLPHGYEGQGPEHSSARLERYLQSCAEDNMIIANCTTPANFFHILRRQMKRNFRKPLIIMTPKSLLRHKLCISTLAELGKGTTFKRIIPEVEQIAKDDKVKRVVLCSGKVYYDLLETRTAQKSDDIAIIRMEQYYPFAGKELKAELARYKNADIVWCQEEPRNMGAWGFVRERIEEVMESIGRTDRVKYIGRPEAASPACGYHKIHEKEQKLLVSEALTLAASGTAKKVAKG